MKLKDKPKQNNLKAEMSHVQNNHDSLSFVFFFKLITLLTYLYMLENIFIVK